MFLLILFLKNIFFTFSQNTAQESKKPVVQKADVFEDDDESGLFSSIPASKPAEPEAEVKEKPKATEKKVSVYLSKRISNIYASYLQARG